MDVRALPFDLGITYWHIATYRTEEQASRG
jgi:hypothetical protein